LLGIYLMTYGLKTLLLVPMLSIMISNTSNSTNNVIYFLIQ
jgi:hypothetical protein